MRCAVRTAALLGALATLALAACATHPSGAPLRPWAERVAALQSAADWQLDGRTAVAFGRQGWQASLDWQQREDTSKVHLAGPFGAGATLLELTPAGLSVNGAPPTAEQAAALQGQLGFELPLAELRYWLLGVPAPSESFDLTRNEEDRARALEQSGWHIAYERYMRVKGDWLPSLMRLEREDVRVRVAVERWVLP